MTRTHISIDPMFPLCWESTETLRIGFDRAEVRLHTPSPAAQRLVVELQTGVHPLHLDSVARRSGLSAEEQERLMRKLEPVLVPARASPTQSSQDGNPAALFAVFGAGSFARGVRNRFEAADITLAMDGNTPDFVVLVEQFLGTTARAQVLLSNDVPHLLIRATDRHLALGPLVLPGGMPCLACLELHGLEKEPALHILAAQLTNETPSAATAHGIDLVSQSALAVARRWQQGYADLVGTRLIFPVLRGLPVPLPESEELLPHSDCGCVTLSAKAPTTLRDSHPPQQ